MSLDISLEETRVVEIYEANYTHNIVPMAEEAGLYEALWHPGEAGIKKAAQLIPIIEAGLHALRSDPEKFEKLNPKNGWGGYDTFLPWLDNLLRACMETPLASVRSWI